MSSYWSALARRLAILEDVRRRGDLPLFARTLGVAVVAPLLTRLPLVRLESLLDWAAGPHRRPDRADPSAVAATVLDALQAGRPLVRPGCLTRGLTLYYGLRLSGVDASLHFGMGRVTDGHGGGGSPADGDGFDGHCWVVLDGQPFLEPRDPRAHYATMYAIPRGA
jgi:hypothetical protein